MRLDILGNNIEEGDILAYNPPYYKGLKTGKCIGFTKAGLPMIEVVDKYWRSNSIKTDKFGNRYYAPKTGFVLCQTPLEDGLYQGLKMIKDESTSKT